MLDQKDFYWHHDMDSTGFKYGRLLDPVQGVGQVETSGASTTVTASNTDNPFSSVNVGDMVIFATDDTTYLKRKVVTVTSPNSIVVDSAVTLAGCSSWWFRPFQIGSTADDGWHKVEQYIKTFVHLEPLTVAASGGIDVRIEIRGRGEMTASKALHELNIPDERTDNVVFEIPVASSVRVGVKGKTGFTGTDSFSAYLLGRLPR